VGCSPESSSSSLLWCFMSGVWGPCLVVVRRCGPCGWSHSGWPSFSLAVVIAARCRRWPLSSWAAVVVKSSLAVAVCWVGCVQLPWVWLVVVAVSVKEGRKNEHGNKPLCGVGNSTRSRGVGVSTHLEQILCSTSPTNPI